MKQKTYDFEFYETQSRGRCVLRKHKDRGCWVPWIIKTEDTESYENIKRKDVESYENIKTEDVESYGNIKTEDIESYET